MCPLDHPATEQTPWGKAVLKKANEGGGWFTWVFSTKDISPIEEKFGRKAIEGHRTRPNGHDLKWRQIGVKEIIDTREFPFFIQWLSGIHPSRDSLSVSKIINIAISTPKELSESWFQDEIKNSLGDISLEFILPSPHNPPGIVSVQFETNGQIVTLD